MYGCAAVTPTDNPDIVRVTELVEKPAAGTAPSNLAVIGRYVIDPAIFGLLENLAPGRGGEIQLTDAIAKEAKTPGTVFGYRFRGQRYDCGTKAGFLQATVAFGLAREDLRGEFSTYLDDVQAMRKAAE